MTHDELLLSLDVAIKSDTQGNKLYLALRAVVTLCDFLNKKGKCCVPVQEVIDAIEKELGHG